MSNIKSITDTNIIINNNNNNTPSQWQINEIKEAAEDVGLHISHPVLRMIDEYMTKDFMDWDVIIQAINRAAFAPRPSWAYVNGILRNWAARGVRHIWDM